MTPGPRPRWRLRPPPSPAAVRELGRALKLSPAFCRLLAARKHDTPDGAKSFLRPLLAELHDPAGLLGAEAAARRLARAARKRERVLVHGDYDVDGIAGTALLVEWLRALGGRAEAFVPHRRDGYDLGQAGVARGVERGATVLVTVDCGTTATRWVRSAGEAGMDVIVTDHHRPAPELPPALALVNPVQPGCGYANKDLCGAGVAFKVGQLTARMLGRPEDEAWERLDLVALATVADQVRLSGENRILVRYGLKAASRVAVPAARPGLAALAARSRATSNGRPLDSGAVAFRLAPRINAAGRMGDPLEALRLLLTRDPGEAAALADGLEAANEERRRTERRIVEEALEALRGSYDPIRDRAVVVAGDGWHPGVVGIVASRIAEQLHRPAVVVALEQERGRGSARSIPEFDVHDALVECREHLERFGGHRQAAGMDVRREKVEGFREAFLAAARERLGEEEPRPVLTADMEVGLDELDADFRRFLRYFGPHGRGNPRPLFVARRVRTDGPAKATKGGHLRFRMVQGRSGLPAFGPRLADRLPAESLSARPVDVAFSLTENTYGGHVTMEAKVRDVRPSR